MCYRIERMFLFSMEVGFRFDFFFFSSRRRHTSWNCDWSSDVCSSDLSRRSCWNRAGPVGADGEGLMKIGMRLPALVAVAALLFGVSVPARAQSQNDAAAIAIGGKDIGGVVSSPQGREAGVWIIAETTELPTQFRRIVVTDDQGRYLIPDLPQADYSVWVRGYGLIDSPKMHAKPGQRLDLAAASAPSAADAAHYYPAIYWYSLLTIPDKKEFGGENGIPAHVTQH